MKKLARQTPCTLPQQAEKMSGISKSPVLMSVHLLIGWITIRMKDRKSSRITIKAGLKRALSGIIAFTFVFNCALSDELGDILRKGIELTAFAANKDTVPEGTVYSEEEALVSGYYDSDEKYYFLDNVNKVRDYSKAYYSFPSEHQDDVVCINFAQSDSSSPINDFLAIGTEECPFNGTIKLVTGSINTLNIPEAFFDYI